MPGKHERKREKSCRLAPNPLRTHHGAGVLGPAWGVGVSGGGMCRAGVRGDSSILGREERAGSGCSYGRGKGKGRAGRVGSGRAVGCGRRKCRDFAQILCLVGARPRCLAGCIGWVGLGFVGERTDGAGVWLLDLAPAHAPHRVGDIG